MVQKDSKASGKKKQQSKDNPWKGRRGPKDGVGHGQNLQAQKERETGPWGERRVIKPNAQYLGQTLGTGALTSREGG